MYQGEKVAAAQHNRGMTRAMQTLLGLCSGIIADAEINEKEILFLRTWLASNADICKCWPGNMIARRIDEIMADGIVSSEEHDSLLSAISRVTRDPFAETGCAEPDAPAIPYDDDPSIFFKNMSFCFTGQFYYGTRAACERAVLKRGAIAVDNVTSRLDYLVVGSIIEPTWANTTFGRKIQLAVQRQEKFGQPAIITEKQWAEAITALP